MKQQWQNFLETYIHPFVNDPHFTPYISILGGVVVFAVILFILSRRSNRSIRVFDNQAGHVHVSNKALSELVSSACKRIGSIHKSRAYFKTSRGKLHILVKLKLEEGKRLAEVSDILQNQLKRTLRDTLSIEKTVLINVVVTGFVKGAVPPQDPADTSAPLVNEPEVSDITAAPEKHSVEREQTADWSLYKKPARTTPDPAAKEDVQKDSGPSALDKPADPPTNDKDIPPPPPNPTVAEIEKKKKSFFNFGSKKKAAEAEAEADTGSDKDTDAKLFKHKEGETIK